MSMTRYMERGEKKMVEPYRPYAISNAYHSNYAIYGKYRVNQVDTTLTQKDPIWLEWDLWRTVILGICRRGK